ncbi:MAG: hypothetical protein Q8R86_09705 [Sulfuricurvum sp.]|nr:hypothetical protein [Sulfuricurvum sp.]
MQSITDLQNSLSELQDIVNSTINPIFSDLQNVSTVLTPIIASHNQVIQIVNDMNTFLNSGIIQGLKGDQGLSYNDTIVIKTNDTAFFTSSATLVELASLTAPLLANSIYEITAYVEFSSVTTTTGLYIGLNTPVSSVDFVDISVPITNVQSSGTLRFLSPNSNLGNNVPAVKGTGVNVANQKLTSIISGHIQTTSSGGDLKIMVGSEVAGSAITIGTNTKLFLRKVL